MYLTKYVIIIYSKGHEGWYSESDGLLIGGVFLLSLFFSEVNIARKMTFLNARHLSHQSCRVKASPVFF